MSISNNNIDCDNVYHGIIDSLSSFFEEIQKQNNILRMENKKIERTHC